MNKIVREHYPVERLPLDLREAAGSARTVTVTLQLEQAEIRSAAELLAEMQAARDRLSIAPEPDPVGRIRALRDEWDR